MRSVENLWPKEFNYFLLAYSEGEAGNEDGLEVTVFPNQVELEVAMSGTLVHSRMQTGTFIEDQPVSFLTYIERTLEKAKQG